VLVATGPVVLVAVGIVGYLGFGYPPWVAVAMTLLTLTTVGFAPGGHLSTGVLVFTAGLALLGVGLFVVILGLAATAIVEGRVSLFSRSRRMRRRVDELRGHYIVCAYGRVGRAIARELEAEGVPFVVVDSKAELEPDLERDGACYLIGDASDEAVLRQAGIERAQGLICAVDSDAENVFITMSPARSAPACSSWPGPRGSSRPTGCTGRVPPVWCHRM
jgi:voltage-gated potassium channel